MTFHLVVDGFPRTTVFCGAALMILRVYVDSSFDDAGILSGSATQLGEFCYPGCFLSVLMYRDSRKTMRDDYL